MNTLLILAAEGPNGRWWPSDVKEFWWGLLAFLIVFGLIVVKGFPLIMAALDKARAKASADAAYAEEATLRAQADATRLRAELGDPEEAGRQMVADAHNSAAQVRADGAAKTQQAVADLRARAESDIASIDRKSVV